jgi:hypothetical protein
MSKALVYAKFKNYETASAKGEPYSAQCFLDLRLILAYNIYG